MSSDNTQEESGLGTMHLTADEIVDEPPVHTGGYDRDTYNQMVAASEVKGQLEAIRAHYERIEARRLRRAALAFKIAGILHLGR